MSNDKEKMDAKLADDAVLINFIEANKSRAFPYGLAHIGVGVVLAFILLGISTVFDLANGIDVAHGFATNLVEAVIISVCMTLLSYILNRYLLRRLNRFNPADFVMPEPQSMGNVRAQFPANYRLGKNTSIGKLVVGEKGVAFIPLQFLGRIPPWILRLNCQSQEWQWNKISRIYKSTGQFSVDGLLFTGSVRDRLALEIGGADEYFIVDHPDQVVAELEKVRCNTPAIS